MPTFKSFDAFEDFSHAVRYNRRFAHDSEGMKFLQDVRESAKTRLVRLQRGRLLCRAQIGHGAGIESVSISEDDYVDIDVDAPFPPERMVPDPKLVGDGRLNPRGIAYLYLASDTKTAIAEVRPWLGADVSVGIFEVLRDCRLVDCSNPKSPGFLFGISGDGTPIEPPEKEWDEIVWGQMSHAFAVPTDPHDSNLTYAPTQILAETLRDERYDGIVYQSAMRSKGKNIVLFDVSSARPFAGDLVRVRSVEYVTSSSARPYSLARETKAPPAYPAPADASVEPVDTPADGA